MIFSLRRRTSNKGNARGGKEVNKLITIYWIIHSGSSPRWTQTLQQFFSSLRSFQRNNTQNFYPVLLPLWAFLFKKNYHAQECCKYCIPIHIKLTNLTEWHHLYIFIVFLTWFCSFDVLLFFRSKHLLLSVNELNNSKTATILPFLIFTPPHTDFQNATSSMQQICFADDSDVW